jgi:hypothetical protein
MCARRVAAGTQAVDWRFDRAKQPAKKILGWQAYLEEDLL